MRVLVYPHTLEVGGSQLNAIDLASAVRGLGASVVVFGQPGALQDRIADLGLEFVEAPQPRRRPSPAVMRALCDLVRDREIDVVHGYEWTTTLEALWGPGRKLGVPVVSTVMSMSVVDFLPSDLDLIVGTEQIAAHERESGRTRVSVIEPPVDLIENSPDAVDSRAFRARYGLQDDDFVVVAVTRLVEQLKLEGLLAAIDTFDHLGSDPSTRLVIVGDGPARNEIESRAAAVNARHGREVVTLTGELSDPRAAYASADVALGMGGSALRALAFGRPLVVQGERGFWKLLTPDTVRRFLWTGWYGVGDNPAAGSQVLTAILRELLATPDRRKSLGDYSRDLAVSRFSLSAAAEVQMRLYERAVSGGARQATRPAIAAASRFVRSEVDRRIKRLLGTEAIDDSNARPVAAHAVESSWANLSEPVPPRPELQSISEENR